MSFIEEYFISPIVQGTGYNIYNTAAYAVILVLMALGTYKLLKLLKINIDSRFFAGILPFIFLGGLMRALEDFSQMTGTALPGLIIEGSGGIGKNILFITPLIYVTMFVIALAAFLISVFAAKHTKLSYEKYWFGIGAVICIGFMAAFVRIAEPNALLLMSLIFLTLTAIFAGLYRFRDRIGLGFLSRMNTFILLAHLFDATTTFVALSFFPYFEQHVLPGFLIGVAGPAVMFPLKLLVVGLVLYAFDKDIKDKDRNIFLKIVVLILGMGPGLRNFFRLIMGV